MNIYCEIKLSPKEKTYLRKKLKNEKIVFSDELAKDKLEHFKKADICFGNINPNWINESNKLKWLQLESVGFAPYVAINKTSIPITNLKGFFDVPVAETVMAGILSLYRGLCSFVYLKQGRVWKGASLRPTLKTVKGSNVLILGSGSIAQYLAKILEGFNCEITHLVRSTANFKHCTTSNLNEVLTTSDIVIGCLPETPKTNNLLDRQRLNLLPAHSIIVNVGRGSLIDEKILIQKLNDRTLAGAVLDVTHNEPLPSDHPLWDCPNTILTQHTGGGFEGEIYGKIDFFHNNYNKIKKGEILNGLVDHNKGY